MARCCAISAGRLSLILFSLLQFLTLYPHSAAGLEDNPVSKQVRIQPAEIKHASEMSFAEPVASPGRAPTDTLYLMGGPGVLSGTFQDAAGQPDRQGWLGVDLTQPTEVRWNISTFNAANLDPEVEDNHAWWCGGLFPPCSPDDPPEGYGNQWMEWLDWYGTVPDPTQQVTVRVKARVNTDTEPALDFLYLQHEGTAYMITVTVWDGVLLGADIDETFVVTPGEYVGDMNDQVHLRFDFSSDGGWSDEDCSWPTDAGAVQIDLIEVYFDQGAGEVQIGATETCETGDPLQWQPTLPQGVGDFSQVWPLLDDLDPDHQNDTPQFAFIDDGEVVPGTGGSTCITWCYGPGGYIVNPNGGLAGPWQCIENEIWSPVLERPAGDLTGAVLSFDVYVHVTAGMGGPWIYHYWKVRSKDEHVGPGNWSEWQSRHYWYGGGPQYVREHHYISDLLLPEYTHVQIALGIIDLQPHSGALDGTPAPYFDNVALKVYQESGPQAIVVKPDGSGDYPTIQAAITAAANNDTILLADGIYTGPGNRDIDYLDKVLFVRSQSGDPTACIIDCQGSESENHRGLGFYADDGPEVVLEGVTVRNGYSVYSGGGIACRGASPTIRNCVFENNVTEGINNFGGGIYCQNASPIITSCVFQGNVGSRGAAIGIGWDSHPSISDCLFVGNSSDGYASAVSCWYYACSATIASCTFVANEASGGIAVISSFYDADLLIENSIIASNVSGTSVLCNSSGTVTLMCSDVFGNQGGDWVGCIAGQLGTAGNINLDPLFCGDLDPLDPFTLLSTSPCAPDYNPGCGLIGARPVGCADLTFVDELAALPGAPVLEQNTPNPFNPRTTIVYALPAQAAVTLRVFDLAGRLVAVLVDDEEQAAGAHTATWTGRDAHGRVLASGTYFYRLEAGPFSQTRRMTLLR